MNSTPTPTPTSSLGSVRPTDLLDGRATDVIASLPEEVRAGRYAVRSTLGEGGMSVVHEAHDRLLDRIVALKELKAVLPSSASVLLREARALAAVSHPAVVSVLAFHAEESPPFLVMEIAHGRPLSSILAEGRLPIRASLRILRQVAAGLDALHGAGILHGDVKPANVMVDDAGAAKVIDVGLTAFVERLQPGAMLGTPSYMPPERARGVPTAEPLAPSADVYSFGVLCFEMLTGRLPFVGASSDVLNAHATRRPPMPSYLAGLSTEFDAPLARALAKDPFMRPPTCLALVTALESASRGSDARGRRLRVVVADDDVDQRALLMSVLGAYLPGASVVLCGSGRSVLEAVTPQSSVAVLDLVMPEPSGLELVRKVREQSPKTAIVIVTGAGSGAERQAARDLGVRRFLIKPFEIDELVLAIREAIEPEE